MVRTVYKSPHRAELIRLPRLCRRTLSLGTSRLLGACSLGQNMAGTDTGKPRPAGRFRPVARAECNTITGRKADYRMIVET